MTTPCALAVAQTEYLVWLCSVHTVGKLHGASFVAQVVTDHRDEFKAMLAELGKAAETEKGFKLGEDYIERLW